MPRWKDSENSTMRRMEASSVVTYRRNATRSDAVSFITGLSLIRNSAPTMTTAIYMMPSKKRVTEWKPAMLAYMRCLILRNLWLPLANFFSSTFSLANDFTTRMPPSVSSTCAFNSPS